MGSLHPAFAGVGLNLSASFPNTVAGQTGVVATISIQNSSTPPDGSGSVVVSSIALVPSCGSPSTTTDCPAAQADPGVFQFDPIGVGAAGSACAGVTFSVGAPQGGTGRVALTPGSVVALGPTGSSTSACTVSLTYSVLRVPSIDASPAMPGVQTDEILSASAQSQTTGVSGTAVVSTPTTVSPATPAIVSRASHSVAIGHPVTDTATLSDGLRLSGTLTFQLYAPGDPNCTGAPLFTNILPVSGAGSYTSSSFPPHLPGRYHWVDAYSGDANNTAVTTACGAANEDVEVTTAAGEFDGDGSSDLTVYRPSSGTWYTMNSGGSPFSQIPWGQPTDIAVPADYDGTGRSQVAIFRPGTGQWFVRHANGSYTVTTWGRSGDVPVPADYEGTGKADLAIFRPSTGEWFVLRQSGGYTQTAWGVGGDIAVPADYDGTGMAELAIFRPSTGQWYVLHAGGTYTVTSWGAAGGGDIPVAGDYEGAGRADLAVFRRSTGQWIILKQNGSYTATVWGAPGSTDIPQLGDFDGDGKIDLTVYRPGSTGTWYVLPSGGGAYTATGWGATGDVPTVLPNAIGHAFFPALYP